MATIAGRGGMLYLQGASGAAATKLGEARSWKFDIDIKTDEDNKLGDTWEHFQPIIRGYTGEITGNFDTAATDVWNAATDLEDKKFYFYPVATTTTAYYYGTAFFKLSVDLNLSSTTRFNAAFTGQGVLSRN